jgi:hypothetical protein
MDDSKEYIWMCSKAEELQKEWLPQNRDFVYVPEDWKIPKYEDRFDEEKEEIIVLSEGIVDVNTEYVKEGVYFIGQSVAWGYESTYTLGPSRNFSSIHEYLSWHLGGDNCPIWDKSWVWLPTQENLQKLCEFPTIDKAKGAMDYLSFNSSRPWTWEQAWLRYYMKTAHNKAWVESKSRWET